MMIPIRALSVLMLLIALGACGSSKTAVTTNKKVPGNVEISGGENLLNVYRATSPRIWEIRKTRVQLSFDFVQKEATGSAMLTVLPYASPQDTLVLDAKSMLVRSVSVLSSSAKSRQPLRYTYDSAQLRIDVSPNALKEAGASFGNSADPKAVDIVIEYVARPYAIAVGGSKAISEDRGLYFINTDNAIPGKPVQIWTQGETESNSHWMPTIDKPNQRTTLDLSLTVPDSMQTLSNGVLVSSGRNGTLRTDRWIMDKPVQVYAIMFAIGRFSIAKDSWQDAGGKHLDVHYYTEPAYAPFARGMFKYTPEMMTFFSAATGVAYPWNKYSQVVVRDYVSGAMENTSASLFGEFVNQNARQLLDRGSEDVVSHELFHQWFGDYVTAESWSNLTLNESFATYGEVLWRRYKWGRSSSDEHAYGGLLGYLASADRGTDLPLVRYYYRDKEEMFDRISYQKGGAILRYINSLTGDTLFNKAMKIYLTGHALQSAEASDWRKALEEATGQDWTPFFNEWYYKGGHPVLRVRYAYNDAEKKVTVTIRQVSLTDSAMIYHLKLKAALMYADHQKLVEWDVSKRTQTYSYPYNKSDACYPAIIPDVLHVLPGKILEEGKTSCLWMTQLQRCDTADYVSKRLAIDAAVADQKGGSAKAILQLGLKDGLASVRAYTLQQLMRLEQPAWQSELTPDVVYLLETDGNNKVRAAALNLLGGWKVRAQRVAITTAISDSSYVVAGAALHTLRMLDADTAYTIAKQILKTDPKNALLDAAWTAVVMKGNPEDLATFEGKARDVYGSTKTAFAANMKRYALAVSSDTVFERTLQLLTQLSKTEAIRNHRFNIGSQVFELVAYYRKSAVAGKESRRAASRIKTAEQYANIILAAENDPENIRRYKQLN